MSRLSWLLSNSVKMAVPSGIYLAMNMLGFVSLHRIDAVRVRARVRVGVGIGLANPNPNSYP